MRRPYGVFRRLRVLRPSFRVRVRARSAGGNPAHPDAAASARPPLPQNAIQTRADTGVRHYGVFGRLHVLRLSFRVRVRARSEGGNPAHPDAAASARPPLPKNAIQTRAETGVCVPRAARRPYTSNTRNKTLRRSRGRVETCPDPAGVSTCSRSREQAQRPAHLPHARRATG